MTEVYPKKDQKNSSNGGKERSLRTSQQNRALHLFCSWLAEELNNAGLDMRVVLKPTYNIPWTTQTVKDHIWRPIQKAMTEKISTKDLSKVEGELNDIHKVIMRELGEKFGLDYIPFPSCCRKCEHVECICNG